MMTHSEDEPLAPRIDALLERQRATFRSGKTLPYAFRYDALEGLLAVLGRREARLFDALWSDLRRSNEEAYLSEIGFLKLEIRHTLRHLKRWMRPKTHVSPLVIAPSTSRVVHQPLGLNLIISPWNFPVQLALTPLIGAVAAGNVAILKPSEHAPASSQAVAEVVREAFSDDHVGVVEGGVEVSKALLARRFDHIFFTGGTDVGRIVARAAAEHLTKVTLELGGKSPAIVMPTADIETTARRIAWGKFLNAGQACIAPDYVLVHDSVHDALVERIRSAIESFYGPDPRESPDYARIIHDGHFERLRALLEASTSPDGGHIAHGGQTDAQQRYIAPTLLTDVDVDHPLMSEEIFGPLLPVLRFSSTEEAIAVVEARPDPLALYLFTREPSDEALFMERVSFGGGCINNTMVHFSDLSLPFGGIGTSGTGAYHGKHSFEVFSHKKSVVKTGSFLDLDLRYPPFRGKLNIFRRVLR